MPHLALSHRQKKKNKKKSRAPSGDKQEWAALGTCSQAAGLGPALPTHILPCWHRHPHPVEITMQLPSHTSIPQVWTLEVRALG